LRNNALEFASEQEQLGYEMDEMVPIFLPIGDAKLTPDASAEMPKPVVDLSPFQYDLTRTCPHYIDSNCSRD